MEQRLRFRKQTMDDEWSLWDARMEEARNLEVRNRTAIERIAQERDELNLMRHEIEERLKDI
jgi:hypothetical protein